MAAGLFFSLMVVIWEFGNAFEGCELFRQLPALGLVKYVGEQTAWRKVDGNEAWGKTGGRYSWVKVGGQETWVNSGWQEAWVKIDGWEIWVNADEPG